MGDISPSPWAMLVNVIPFLLLILLTWVSWGTACPSSVWVWPPNALGVSACHGHPAVLIHANSKHSASFTFYISLQQIGVLYPKM